MNPKLGLHRTTFCLITLLSALIGQSALAVPIAITAPPDLANAVFTNIDWSSSGTAFTTGFSPSNNTNFTITFFANAVQLTNGLVPLSTPTLDTSPNGATSGKNYELTTVVVLSEHVVSCVGQTCFFDQTGGSFAVYFDLARNANNTLGTGFSDGELLVSGTVDATSGGTGGTFISPGFNGSGDLFFTGIANLTQTTCNSLNPACLSPAVSSTTFVTTFQQGSSATAPSAGGFDGVPFNASNMVFQADANQAFIRAAAVPEPGLAWMICLGLTLIGVARRRHRRGVNAI